MAYVDCGINCTLSQRMRPLQKQCQSSSIQCAGVPYPRSFEHPLIQSSLFTGGQMAPLNGLFHGQTGCLPNMANTKASERQIFNWSTSASQRQYHLFFGTFIFLVLIHINLFSFCLLSISTCEPWEHVSWSHFLFQYFQYF